MKTNIKTKLLSYIVFSLLVTVQLCAMDKKDDNDEDKAKLAAAAASAAMVAAASTEAGLDALLFLAAVGKVAFIATGVGAGVAVVGGVGYGIYRYCNAEDGYELHRAAQAGNIAEVNRLLARNVEVNRQNDAGMTPIILACRGAHCPVIEALGRRHANPNIQDNVGDAALIFAIRSRSFEAVRRLVEHAHPDLMQLASDHRLPQEVAAAEAGEDVAYYLTEHQRLGERLNAQAAQAAPAQAEPPIEERVERHGHGHEHRHRAHPYEG
jgi:FOG: Ankyrin repeat